MKSAPLARRLLALLALLPAGLAEANVHTLLGERGIVSRAVASGAVVCLHQLRLVERRPDRRLRMLTPLRECARHDVHVMPNDQTRLFDRYLAIAVNAGKIGTSDWERLSQDVEAETDNLDPVCELAVATNISHRELDGALIGLADFHRFSGRGAVNSLSRLIARLDESNPLRIVQLMLSLGYIAIAHSDYETASRLFGESLPLSQRAGAVQSEANSVYGLGQIALFRPDLATAVVRFETALALFRRCGLMRSAANCIDALGNIAFTRSDHTTASSRLEEALPLYRRNNDLVGAANCTYSLGVIALQRAHYETAVDHFERARMLYRRCGAVAGEGSAIFSRGMAAIRRFDYESAMADFEESLVFYRRCGDVGGEATCIRGFGEIALRRLDHGMMAARFDEALALYQKTERRHSIAEIMIRRGWADRGVGETSRGRGDIEAGFSIYFQTTDTEDRALPGWQALHRSLVCDDAAEAARYRDEARAIWIAIQRLDLLSDWLDLAP